MSPIKIDPTTLNFKKIEPPLSQKRLDGIIYKNLHVLEDLNYLTSIHPWTGMSIKIHGFDKHKNELPVGSLVTIISNSKTPDVRHQSDKNRVDDFISKKFHILNDNPKELKGYVPAPTKIETEVTSEEIAQKGFNYYKEKDSETGEEKTYCQL